MKVWIYIDSKIISSHTFWPCNSFSHTWINIYLSQLFATSSQTMRNPNCRGYMSGDCIGTYCDPFFPKRKDYIKSRSKCTNWHCWQVLSFTSVKTAKAKWCYDHNWKILELYLTLALWCKCFHLDSGDLKLRMKLEKNKGYPLLGRVASFTSLVFCPCIYLFWLGDWGYAFSIWI